MPAWGDLGNAEAVNGPGSQSPTGDYDAGVASHVLARKYRPQTFAEVSGQGAVSRTLSNAIRRNRVAHAYLFTGPRGVGKTSSARILAKALCCDQGPTPTPCGVCDQCRMITDGSHPDVVEIDAARYTGVDDVRELSESAGFSPSLARARVFILDEVHMFSRSAWNALLKLLEEPPPHVHFIMATTEVEKVLPTVLSRSQRFDFRPITSADIVESLRGICVKEGAVMPEVVLHRIARSAAGGMRDAQTLLDQLISISEDDPETDLDLLLGAARSGDLSILAGHLAHGRHGEALEALDRILGQGVAAETLLQQLIDHTRALLLLLSCGADSPAFRRLGPQDEHLEEQAKAMGIEKALRMAQVLTATAQAMRAGGDARLQLDLACVRVAQSGAVQDLDGLLRRLERLDAPRPR